jgi:hypothetical protein
LICNPVTETCAPPPPFCLNQPCNPTVDPEFLCCPGTTCVPTGPEPTDGICLS